MQNKLKIGILGCGYSCEDRLDERLYPWFKIAQKYNIIFSFVSARFSEYEDLNINQNNLPTTIALNWYKKANLIQYLEIPEESMSEADARNLALKHLLNEKCDYISLLDLSDEFYTEEQIEKIIEYISREDNKFYGWFSLNFKNYIGDDNHWVDGFHPPRIFRNKFTEFVALDKMTYDNDVQYIDKLENKVLDYRYIPNKNIPKNIAFIKHLTWQSNQKSKEKIEYQEKRWGKDSCSYKWDDINNKIIFNKEYYKKIGQEVPVLNKDE